MEKGELDTSDEVVSSPPASQTTTSASSNADSSVASGGEKPPELPCAAGEGGEKKGQEADKEVKSKQQEKSDGTTDEMESVDGHMYSIIDRGGC